MPIALADTMPPSWDLVADIQILLHYHFMQNAYLAGTLVALTAGIMGYFMVLRSQSFAGHSLANVGFAGATGAVLFGIPPIVGLFLAGVLAAVGIQTLNLAARQNRQSDIAVGAVLTASLALGFLFIFLATAEYAANVYNVLFGNVLGISDTDVGVIVVSTLVLLGVLLLIARPLFFASLDPDVAAASGAPVRLLASGYLVLLALAVAVAGLVGSFVVLRARAFAGESLSVVALPGALGRAALGLNPFVSLLVPTIAVAVAMGGFGERLRGRDVAIGTVLAWVLGLGVLFRSLFTTQVSGTGTGFSGVTVLFGHILGISTAQTYSIAVLSALGVLVLLFIACPVVFAS